jgi:hypothetical protein
VLDVTSARNNPRRIPFSGGFRRAGQRGIQRVR